MTKFQIPNSKFQRKGFTLIEILVVISVIGLLAGLLLVRFAAMEKASRDTKRKSDLNQYRLALENYSIRQNGVFPSRTYSSGVGASSTLCPDLTSTYMASCLEDPLYSATNWDLYRYQSDGTGNGTITATKYVLWAKTETGLGYWVICSNGKIGEMSSVSTSSGTCPLP